MVNIMQAILEKGDRGRVRRIFILIIILTIVSGLIVGGKYYNRAADWLAVKTGQAINLPRVKEIPFRLGLDLLGGTHLVYEADMSEVPPGDQTSALKGVRDVIERRVNAFGVSEPVVQTSMAGGHYRLIVELAGVKDVNEAINMIGETPLLEFKEQSDEAPKLTDEEKAKIEGLNKEAEKRAEEVLGKLLSGGDFAAMAKQYSQDDKTKDADGDMGWITAEDRPEVAKFVQDMKVGDISKDLVRTSRGFEIFKLEGEREKVNPFNEKEKEMEVKASHLLICYQGAEKCNSNLTKEEAYAKIKEIKREATPKNFKELVKKYSTEPGAAQTGGELGWFGRGKMVKPFADAVFNQKVGTISYVVETKFGYHLIYKEDEKPVMEYHVRHIFIPTVKVADIVGDKKEWKNTELTGKNLKRATVQFNPNDGMPEVALQFDDEGAKMFAEITERNIGKPVAIFLDSYPISVPTVNEKIPNGKAVISGKFNIKEAKLLAQRLNAGALPVPIKLVSQQTVGPSLGRLSLIDSLRAGIIGLILIALFMILYYRLPGLLAVIALILYGLLISSIFKIWPVTLTLAGLAGFILSIGMAVDANVLIFERLKEEIEGGKPLSLAVVDSFNRAWPSIRDGNVSTLITCFILIQFSTSIVKGFAITLGLGVIISMFSAIVITKTFLQLVIGQWLEKKLWLTGAKRK